MANRRGRASRTKNNYVWSVVSVNRAILTTVTSENLVQDSDWNPSGGQKRATIIAVRGYLMMRAVGVLVSDCHMYLGIMDEDVATSPDPALAATYVDEDIMWTGGFCKSPGAQDARQLFHMDINIKAKRKIRSGQELRLNSIGTNASELRLIGILRTLMIVNNG